VTEPLGISEDARPERRPSVEHVAVGEAGVLRDGAGGRLFGLNHAATVLWARSDGRTTLRAMAAALAPDLELAEEAVLADLREGVQALHARGLLLLDDAHVELWDPVAFDVGFGEHRVAVSPAAPEADRILRRLFRHMIGAGGRRRTGWVGLREEEPGEDAAARYRVEPTDVRFDRCFPLAEALGVLKRLAVERFVAARPDLVWLHAGAVARDGRAVVVVGPWGSGKSRFVTALQREGWSYHSDDVVPLEPGTGRVLPFPLAPQPRGDGGELLPRERLEELGRAMVEIPETAVASGPDALGALVFPRYDPDAPDGVVRLTPVETVTELSRHWLGRDRPDEQLARLGALAERVPAVRVRYRDAEAFVGALPERLEELS